MVFELGKCYQHNSGYQYYICGSVNSIAYGKCFIAENGRDKKVIRERGLTPEEGWNNKFTPVGIGEGYAENYYEIPYEKFFLDNYIPSMEEERMMKRKLKLRRLVNGQDILL